MIQGVLALVFNMIAVVILLSWRRLGRREHALAVGFLVTVAAFDGWTGYLAATDPRAATIYVCAGVLGKDGWQQKCR